VDSTALPVSFKALLASLPRGEPLSTAALQTRGLSAFRASALARSGWLVHLARGVYMLSGDTLTRDGSLAFLSAQTPGFHVGSKTALAWRGVRQNIAFREHLSLWGDTSRRLPEWFTQRFPAGYQATQLFDGSLRTGFGLQPLPAGDPRVLVSVPERAMLELLSDVGKVQSLTETRELVESLPGLRDKVLDELLQHTTRIKVVRMAATFASSMKLPWASLAVKHSERIGGGARWVAVGRSGERLDLRRP
jgi:Transcriptional regulator, AbiEi antitoxin, Type IV TA system/Transcriptional regulator, AbiEi antitoxin N-terminal domain